MKGLHTKMTENSRTEYKRELTINLEKEAVSFLNFNKNLSPRSYPRSYSSDKNYGRKIYKNNYA